MAQISSSSKTWIAFSVAAVAIVCFMNYQQANSTPVAMNCNSNECINQQSEPEPINADEGAPWDNGLTMIPFVPDCGADEENAPGMHPSCEPTCLNKNPVCIKIYFMDYVPCFCKKGLLRDTQSKKCVPESECPTTTTTTTGRKSRDY